MRAMLRGRHAWVLHALSGNPLVRSHDRLEALVTVIGVIVAIIAIPVVIQLSGDEYAQSLERIEQQTRSLQLVEATVVDVTPAAAPGRFATPPGRVRAQWKVGFQERTETVRGPAKAQVGDRIDVWLDSRGTVTRAPQTVADARGFATAFGIALWLVTATLCAIVLLVTRAYLNRQRFSAWDHEWKLLSASGGGWANRGRSD